MPTIPIFLRLSIVAEQLNKPGHGNMITITKKEELGLMLSTFDSDSFLLSNQIILYKG